MTYSYLSFYFFLYLFIYFFGKALNAHPCVGIHLMQNDLFSFSPSCKYLRKLPGPAGERWSQVLITNLLWLCGIFKATVQAERSSSCCFHTSESFSPAKKHFSRHSLLCLFRCDPLCPQSDGCDNSSSKFCTFSTPLPHE